MLKIDMRCSCGAEFHINDTQGVFFDVDGKPDKKGRRFVIEKRADEWLEIHWGCISGKEHKLGFVRSELPQRMQALEIQE